MKTVLKPLFDRLILQRDPLPEEEVRNGVVIPNSAQDPKNEGTVIAVGGDVKIIRPGDRVIFNTFAGLPFKAGAETYVSLKEVEIFGVVTQIEDAPLEPEELHQ
jgi:chaperonin GroES